MNSPLDALGCRIFLGTGFGRDLEASAAFALFDLFADLRKTLDRLGVDHIDIFTLHRDDRDRPAHTILETLYGLVEEGLIASYGTSNWGPARIAALEACAENRSMPAPVLSSVDLSLPFPNFEIWPNSVFALDGMALTPGAAFWLNLETNAPPPAPDILTRLLEASRTPPP